MHPFTVHLCQKHPDKTLPPSVRGACIHCYVALAKCNSRQKNSRSWMPWPQRALHLHSAEEIASFAFPTPDPTTWFAVSSASALLLPLAHFALDLILLRPSVFGQHDHPCCNMRRMSERVCPRARLLTLTCAKSSLSPFPISLRVERHDVAGDFIHGGATQGWEEWG